MKQQIAIAVGALAIGAHAVQGKPSRPASQRSGPDAIPAGGTKDISGGPGGHPILPRDAAPVGWEWELDESGTLVARGEDFSGGLFRREGPPGGGRGGFEGGRGGMGPPGGGRGGMEGGRGGYGGPPGRGGGDMAARGGTWMRKRSVLDNDGIQLERRFPQPGQNPAAQSGGDGSSIPRGHGGGASVTGGSKPRKQKRFLDQNDFYGFQELQRRHHGEEGQGGGWQGRGGSSGGRGGGDHQRGRGGGGGGMGMRRRDIDAEFGLEPRHHSGGSGRGGRGGNEGHMSRGGGSGMQRRDAAPAYGYDFENQFSIFVRSPEDKKKPAPPKKEKEEKDEDLEKRHHHHGGNHRGGQGDEQSHKRDLDGFDTLEVRDVDGFGLEDHELIRRVEMGEFDDLLAELWARDAEAEPVADPEAEAEEEFLFWDLD